MTLRELGIKLAWHSDEASQKKVEQSIASAKRGLNNLAKTAKKVAAAMGAAVAVKAIINKIKQIEAVQNALDEEKKRWGSLFKELDKATGFSREIVKWIREISNRAMALFRRIMPQAQRNQR